MTTKKAQATPDQKKDEALECLAHVYKDFSMLASGEWVPDEDRCEASQGGILNAIRLLVEAGALPKVITAKQFLKRVNNL